MEVGSRRDKTSVHRSDLKTQRKVVDEAVAWILLHSVDLFAAIPMEKRERSAVKT
jgi:hypothetical protein